MQVNYHQQYTACFIEEGQRCMAALQMSIDPAKPVFPNLSKETKTITFKNSKTPAVVGESGKSTSSTVDGKNWFCSTSLLQECHTKMNKVNYANLTSKHHIKKWSLWGDPKTSIQALLWQDPFGGFRLSPYSSIILTSSYHSSYEAAGLRVEDENIEMVKPPWSRREASGVPLFK